ncbi:Fe-S cluster assembly protein SufD [Fructobacillus ficulneus]|uniref:Iron-sulfur cluster assembly protein SufD n=1 Tax=Fructobacillus ficulneus TaxID=157463 RepID=A0A0K8MIA5_9LACO|nr:Fe-S cluster assembly protein SufD [Fructobacillus ficulneus]GAO99594.1 iron-sulfur cluster assembly protein SufD [Fructobacillus ficulneus]
MIKYAEKADQALELPVFDKVRYDHWGLDEIQPGQGQSDQTYYAQGEEVGLEVVGQSATYLYLTNEMKKAGVLVMPIKDAKLRYPEMVDLVQGKVATADQDRLTAANELDHTTGIFVYIPSKIKVEPKIHLYLNHLVEAGDLSARVLVYMGANSSAEVLLETHTVGETASKATIVVEVMAESQSKLTFANFDDLSARTNAFINRQAVVKNQAKVDWINAAFSDGNIVSQVSSRLIGEGAASAVKVAAFTNQKQVQGFNTEVQNIGRHTIGHIYQRGVILNSSSLVFNGRGTIIKGAKGSDAQQESRVLMLSERGRGEANPLLLIDESDVTAGHAASVGQVDEQQLYYLMSRGLPEHVARRLVVRGFVGEVLAKLPDVDLQNRVIAAIERKLAYENRSL